MVKKAFKHTGATYLHAIRNNEAVQLDALYKEFFPGISRFVLRNSGQEGEAHDVFQEALIVIYRKAQDSNFAIEHSFQNYLFTICKQIWRNELRKKGRQQVSLDEAPPLFEAAEIETELISRDKDELYRKKFLQLGADCQKLLQLFFDKVSMSEIAKAMGYGSVNYAKKRKFKCKESLLQLIQSDPLYAELTDHS